MKNLKKIIMLNLILLLLSSCGALNSILKTIIITEYPIVEEKNDVKIKKDCIEKLQLDSFRLQLKDYKMIDFTISVNYKAEVDVKKQDIELVVLEIRDAIIKFVTQLSGSYFSSENSLNRFEKDLLEQINGSLQNGEIDKIYFEDYLLL